MKWSFGPARFHKTPKCRDVGTIYIAHRTSSQITLSGLEFPSRSELSPPGERECEARARARAGRGARGLLCHSHRPVEPQPRQRGRAEEQRRKGKKRGFRERKGTAERTCASSTTNPKTCRTGGGIPMRGAASTWATCQWTFESKSSTTYSISSGRSSTSTSRQGRAARRTEPRAPCGRARHPHNATQDIANALAAANACAENYFDRAPPCETWPHPHLPSHAAPPLSCSQRPNRPPAFGVS